jgi:hypothetical protein
MWLAVGFASVALAANTQPAGPQATELAVSTDPVASIGHWMPGDEGLVQVIELRATGHVRYQIQLAYDGSREFAETLLITVTTSSGALLYSGPLADAAVGVSDSSSGVVAVLADGQSEVISISAELPLEASPDLAGAQFRFDAAVSWTPDL